MFGDYMYTIKENIIREYEINKSRFITLIYKINNEDDVKKYLNDVKNKYKDATHYCYGYIIDSNYRFSDDGEPGGTAGAPIFNVINENNLNNVLCIVVRYFGGIKLGAGGLVRAYSNCVSKTLIEAIKMKIIDGYQIELNIEYENIDRIDYLLRDKQVIYKEFNDKIKYIINIDKENLDILDNFKYKIIKEIKIEKDL